MTNKIKKIALLTGGGDCPGLNAVIRAATRTALNKGIEVIGYKFGYRGLYLNDFEVLTEERVSGIENLGGTILYSSNKDNLFNYEVEEKGKKVRRDVSDIAIKNMKKEGVDALVIIGGDGTLTSARDFSRKGVKVIGVPKTIDNDLAVTDVTFGFNSALDVARDALDRLHTTAKSHHRIMILEVMGRDAGWIALHSGIAGSAHIIIIPEIPYDINKIIERVNKRQKKGKLYTIIAISEGATAIGGEKTISQIVKDSPDPIRLGGVGNLLALQIREKVKEHEVRATTLGHLQRGGSPSTFDRVLAARYGVKAVELLLDERYGNMVTFTGGEMSFAHLENIIGRNKLVDPKGELVNASRSIGVTFAD